MANEGAILVADPEVASARRLVAQLNAAGVACTASHSAAQAMIQLASGTVWVVVLAPGFPCGELEALAHAAHKHAAVPLLCAPLPAPTATWELALALGCRGLLERDSDPERTRAALAAARAQRRSIAQRSSDLQRLRFQHEELRRLFAEQTERFQETQETYFLDLSRMMTIISNIMDGIVFADRDGNVTLLNPVAEDLLGVKSFVAVGKPLRALQGRTELVQALVADHDRIGAQKEVGQTVEVHHSEQDLLYIKCITSSVHDYRGQVAGLLTVLKDVTAEYKSDQLKNQYLSIVAHELRTPLTGIKTFSSMMVKGTLGTLTDKQQRVCESIREQSLRLEHQIDKLINLGHLESDDYGQDREVFALSDFAAGLVAPFEQPARDRRIELAFTIEAKDEPMYADRADLRRACQALIENAVKFTPDGGRVRVLIQDAPDGSVRFTVRDDGIGIDPRYHRRIFEKFFQVEDPLTRHHGGAGLGLFVARGIVEAHGSRIEVSSKLGHGAEFSLALPMYGQRGASPEQNAAQNASERTAEKAPVPQ